MINILEGSFVNKEVSDEEYFSEEYRDYISNSALGLMNPAQGGGPIRFLQGFKNADKNNEALLMGTAIHRMTLEKDIYDLSETEKPGGKIGDVVQMIFNLRNREEVISIYDAVKTAFIAKDYYAKQITNARIKNVFEKGLKYYIFLKSKKESVISLTSAQKEIATNCINSVRRFFVNTDKDVVVYNEFPIFAKFLYWHSKLNNFTNAQLKCKIDRFEIDNKNKIVTLIDLKTTGNSVDNFMYYDSIEINEDGTELINKKCLGSFFKYHYYRQLAMYGWMLKQYCINELGLKDYKFFYRIVAVEKLNPYRAMEFDINERLISIGEQEFIYLFDKVLFYKNKGFDYIEQ